MIEGKKLPSSSINFSVQALAHKYLQNSEDLCFKERIFKLSQQLVDHDLLWGKISQGFQNICKNLHLYWEESIISVLEL